MATTLQIEDATVIRNVDLKLDGFKDVFQTISVNIVEQTNMLRSQIKADQKQEQIQRNKSEFDELEREKAEKDTDSGTKYSRAESDKRMGETVDKIVGKFTLANAASTLKNAAMAAAGAFVGYNLLKGFVNEETDGGFDRMIDGLATIGPKMQEFAAFDMVAMRENFDSMTASFSSISTTLTNLDTTINDVKTAFDEFSKNPIGQTLGFIWENIGLISVSILSLKAYIATQNFRARRFNFTSLINGGNVVPTTGPDDGSRTPRGSGRGIVGMQTPEQRMALRQGFAAQSGGQFRTINGGRNLVNTATNRIVNDASTITPQSVARQLTGRELAAFNLIKKVLTRFVAPALLAATLIQVGMILGDTSTTDEQKMALLAPVIGAVVGGLAGASIGAALGITAGPWGALFGAVALGVVGSLSGEALGMMIAKYAFGFAPDSDDESQIQKAQGIYAGYDQMTQQNFIDEAQNFGLNTDSGSPDYMKYADPNYNAASDPSSPVHLRRGGGRGQIVEQMGERQAYRQVMDANLLDALIIAERNAQEVATQTEILKDDTLAYLQSIGNKVDDNIEKANTPKQAPVIINAPQNNPVTVNNVQGAQSQNSLSVIGGSGRDAGFVQNFLPYFSN